MFDFFIELVWHTYRRSWFPCTWRKTPTLPWSHPHGAIYTRWELFCGISERPERYCIIRTASPWTLWQSFSTVHRLQCQWYTRTLLERHTEAKGYTRQRYRNHFQGFFLETDSNHRWCTFLPGFNQHILTLTFETSGLVLRLAPNTYPASWTRHVPSRVLS